MIIYKNIIFHRGDKETVKLEYPGDISSHNLNFVLKKDREPSSSRKLELLKDFPAGAEKMSAVYDEKTKITRITITPDTADTQDLSGNYVFDIFDSTDSVTRVDGNFYIEPDVQTPFDGTDLPEDGKRYVPYYPENFNNNEVLQYDASQRTFRGKTPGSLTDDNFYNKSQVDSSLSTKVDRIPGKGLSSNDFTDGIRNLFDSNNQLLTNGIKDSNVTFSKLSFIKNGKNLFNYATIQIGKYISFANGLFYINPNYNCSDFIQIRPGNTHTINIAHFIAFFDSNKGFISGIDNSMTNENISFIPPAQSMYIVFDFISSKTNIQLEIGNIATHYEPYCKYIDSESLLKLRAQFLSSSLVDNNTLQLVDEVLSIKSIPANLVSNGIKTSQLNYTITGKNKFNKLTEISNFYVSSENGLSYTSLTYNHSDFIHVNPNTRYICNSIRFAVFFNSLKGFISGISFNGGGYFPGSFITPVNAAYTIISYANDVTNIQLELGEMSTNYESYRYIIDSDSSVPVFSKNIDLTNATDNTTIQYSDGLLELKSVPVNKLAFIDHGKNLFNIDTQIVGHYASSITGGTLVNLNYNCSDFIRVQSNTQYACNYIRMVAFYDIDKNFLSGISYGGIGITPGNFATAPNTGYCRITYSNSVTNIQLEEGAVCTPFESFRYIIREQNAIPIFVKNIDEAGIILPRLVLPSKIYVAIGRELNLWYNSLSYEIDYDKRLYHKCLATVGLDLSDRFKYTPLQIETNTITIQIYNSELNNLSSASTTLQSVSKTSGSGVKQILFIGDSFISQDIMIAEIKTLIDSDGGITSTFIGTKGTNPNFHEGRSGWTFAKYISNTNDGTNINPFWDTSINDNNFQKYMLSNGFSGNIDFCVLYLGINDIAGIQGDASDVSLDNIILNIKCLVDDLLSVINGYPNCKIIIVFPTLFPIDRTYWATQYYSSGNSSIDLRNKRNMFLYYQKLLMNFDSGIYNPNVSLCASSFWMDRSSNFQSFKILTRNRSMRDSSQETYVSDVHPSIVGYKYLADAIYSHLRALF